MAKRFQVLSPASKVLEIIKLELAFIVPLPEPVRLKKLKALVPPPSCPLPASVMVGVPE